MTCKATIRMICEYLEGRLSPSVAATMRAHLEECTDCRLVLEAAQRTLEVYFDGEQPVPHTARVA
jgi:predicted anti-sigma-YlaC factor YlaD